MRRKRDASINVCMRLVREGKADAVVTAGHTGAGVASAILNLGRLPGVDRPALAVQMVTDQGPVRAARHRRHDRLHRPQPVPVRAHGRDLRRAGPGRGRPSVALLSIGEEGGKGEQRVQEATELLRASDLRFVGNVEGKDLPHHPADVVVCDASRGQRDHQVLRGALDVHLRHAARASSRARRGGPSATSSCARASPRIRARFDYERLGGAPLLGVKGTVLITHGRAKRRMIGFAVEVGAAAARARIPERIAAALAADARTEEQVELVSDAAPDGVALEEVAPPGGVAAKESG